MLHSLYALLLGLVLLAPPASAADAQASAPAVRALLFYAERCPPCQEVFDYLLPALAERYGRRLEVAAVDAARPEGAALYRAAAAAHGAPAEWAGVPTALVAERVLVGADAIAAGLGDAFEALAANPAAARWPDLPGLPALLSGGLETVQARLAGAPGLPAAEAPPAAAADRDRIANALAVVVLVGMLGALGHALARVRRAGAPGRAGGWAVPALALLGIGISAYTGYTSLAGVSPVCGPIGSCDLVQSSEYAKLFGIPMGVLGVLGYAATLVTWRLGRRRSPAGGGWRWLPWAIAFAGVLFSIRLTALEPFVIGHTCLWCLASAITMTSLFWVISGETRAAGRTSPVTSVSGAPVTAAQRGEPG
jgi:uncharacterized membrane protein